MLRSTLLACALALAAPLVGLGMLYTWIAWRFWFHIPLIGCALATGLMIAGWSV